MHNAASAVTFKGSISGRNVSLTGVNGQVMSMNQRNLILPVYSETENLLNLRTSIPRHILGESRYYKQFSNGLLGETYTVKKNTGGKSDEKLYIVHENYNFPTVTTQQYFSSRVRVEQPTNESKQQMIFNRPIHSIDTSTMVERKVE